MNDLEQQQRYDNLEYLRNKLRRFSQRAEQRYAQYDEKFFDRDVGFVIPEHIRRKYRSSLGWTTSAVDAIADRLEITGFKDDNFGIEDIFNINNPDILFDSAILNALVASCSFIYISKGPDEEIRLQVIESLNATGIIDPITNLLKEGYAVLERDKRGNPILEAYFEPYVTTILSKDEEGNEVITPFEHEVPYPLLVPIIHRPDAKRPFGRSRITRAAEYWQRYAKRTLERADITAEFYSFPQKYVTGVSKEHEQMDTWRATVSSMLVFEEGENGERPNLGQFTAPNMTPFTEQLRMAASGFAGETGLTLDDLGFVSDNPSSAEAIKASHESLRAKAEKAQKSFTSGFINVGFLSVCLRDNYPYFRNAFYKTKIKWAPIFKPDASTLSLIGDGAIKLGQSNPDFLDDETLSEITGLKGGAK